MDSETDLKDKAASDAAPDPAATQIEEGDQTAAAKQAVKDWNKRIDKAAEKYKPDFDRMWANMAFAASRQWPDQKTIQFDKYVANITVQALQSILSHLYARNPQCTVTKRKRRDFKIWDGKTETLAAAQAAATMPFNAHNPQEMMHQMQAQMQGRALLADYQSGEQYRKLIDNVAETLEIIYAWQIDNQQPSFKRQCKQMVFRALVTSVGYAELAFSRQFSGGIMSSETESGMLDRSKRAQALLDKMEKGEIQADAKEVETLRELTLSLAQSAQNKDANNVNERLHWNFLSSTSVIADENCTQLDGFVGADWVCHESWVPLDTINAYFETDIKGDQVSKQGDRHKDTNNKGPHEPEKPKVLLRHVWQLSTKCHFYILRGYDKFVMEPEPVEPESDRFWPIHTLVLTPVESCEESQEKGRVSIFPPSHVDLLRPAAEEWNRCRETLREQRKANQPKYVANAQYFPGGETSDLQKLASAEPNEIILATGMTPDTDINKVLVALKHAPIDPAVYDVSQSLQDIMMTSSSQEANLGPPGKRVTATGETIAEQSRTSILGSYVDNLDDFLSGLAQQGGEYLLRELSPESAERIAGQGAVWPAAQEQREQFIQDMYLDIKAASSGRPNQALHIANAKQIAPLLMQAGANPKAMVRWLAHVLDEQMDETDFFPLVPQNPPSPPGGTPPKPTPGPAQHQPQLLHNSAPALGAGPS